MKLFTGSSKKNNYMVLLIMGWLTVIESPFLIGGSVFAYMYTQKFLETAVKTEGTVIELVERRGENGVTYAPVYTFSDTRGEEHKIYSGSSSYPPDYEVGEEVQVLYDPSEPQKAKIDSFFELWGISAILAVIGSISLFLGPLFIFIGHRIKTKNEPID